MKRKYAQRIVNIIAREANNPTGKLGQVAATSLLIDISFAFPEFKFEFSTRPELSVEVKKAARVERASNQVRAFGHHAWNLKAALAGLPPSRLEGLELTPPRDPGAGSPHPSKAASAAISAGAIRIGAGHDEGPDEITGQDARPRYLCVGHDPVFWFCEGTSALRFLVAAHGSPAPRARLYAGPVACENIEFAQVVCPAMIRGTIKLSDCSPDALIEIHIISGDGGGRWGRKIGAFRRDRNLEKLQSAKHRAVAAQRRAKVLIKDFPKDTAARHGAKGAFNFARKIADAAKEACITAERDFLDSIKKGQG